MRTSWSMTPLAWTGVAGIIVYWGVIAAESYDIDALSAPLGLFGNVVYFLFFFPVTLSLIVLGSVGWRALRRRCFEASACASGLLLLLSIPMMLAMTVYLLETRGPA